MTRKVYHGRTIIIGDVHGCHSELAKLLRMVSVVPEVDRVIFIGDLINKGPDSKRVWDLFCSVGGESILGNHEWNLLRLLDGADRKHTKYVQGLESSFGSQFPVFVDAVRTWPLWMDLGDYLLVHAGLAPGKHPSETEPRILTSIRTWDGCGKNLSDPAHVPWFELYDGNQTIVFGHWAALGGLNHENIIGLDTGCVYGGALTALILPDRQFVRVQAEAVYCPIRV